MRLFVFEYVTGGGLGGRAAPDAFVGQGRMMISALVADLARIPGVTPVVARDPQIALGSLPAEVVTVAPGDPWVSWRRIIAGCDAVWPIAPETDGVLERAAALVLEAGKPLLASRPEALAIARSKRATARHLAAHGTAAVPTFPIDALPPPSETGFVVKPDDGAGAEDTVVLADAAALAAWRAAHPASAAVLQPYLPGEALSLSLLAKDGAAWLLSCNRQQVERHADGFHYRGGIIGGAEARRAALAPVAAGVAAALPGLWGYVGIDLIDGPAGPVVLEINPRLTLSYAGLGRSIGLNPAALVLALRERAIAEIAHPLTPQPVEVLA